METTHDHDQRAEPETDVTQADSEILVRRTFEAPRSLVWRMFTEPEQLAMWWGPTGFTTSTAHHDCKVGGQWRYTMHGPDGQGYENLINYLEVDEPTRLVYKHGGEVDVEPIDFTVEVTFEEEQPGRTRVVMRSVFPTPEAKHRVVSKYNALDGARQTMGRLAEHLARASDGGPGEGDTLLIRRVFDAPVELVWQAWTTPEHMINWFAPAAWKLTQCDIDLRAGGFFHYRMEGEGFPSSWGVWWIREVARPSRLTFVSSFSDAERRVVRAPFSEHWPLETHTVLTLEPHAGRGGGTVMTMRAHPMNATDAEHEAFRGMFEGMQQGWGQTLDSLSRFLSER